MRARPEIASDFLSDTPSGEARTSAWMSGSTKRPSDLEGVLWSYFLPKRGRQTTPTVVGLVLSVLAVGIGSAAYFSSSNILFLALSVILASLILSGLLSQVNFSKTEWRLSVSGVLRVGQMATLCVEARNKKTRLSTYALWFDVEAVRGLEQARLRQNTRLDAAQTLNLEWPFTPKFRGRERLQITSIVSHFPFGFLRKTVEAGARCDVSVWPERIAYELHAAAAARLSLEHHSSKPRGSGSAYMGLRPYAKGDSQRLVHWKASARRGSLLVRQTAVEEAEEFWIWVQPEIEKWSREEQFETLCRLAATLAEDLFQTGRLLGWRIGNAETVPVRAVRDVNAFLDALALLKPTNERSIENGCRSGTVIQFAPEGERRVSAHAEGTILASA